MKKNVLHIILFFTFAALSGGLLFYTSQSVQRAEDELYNIQVSVLKEKEAIHALKAEWAFLNSPARLEALALEYLDLVPPDVGQIISDASSLFESVPVLQDSFIEENFHEISSSELKIEKEAFSSVFVTPRKKPIRKNAVIKKRFDTILNEIIAGGVE
ncbi:MAG: hypothetical protein KAJ86_03715 [Alphaproteobacteria bacterium]|nr:hypothetical protein [Alphaproteobacteria bacterium]